MIKMLVVDIDGTIMGDNRRISDSLKAYVKLLLSNGIKVVIATGRMYCSAAKIACELGTDSPIIAYQGGLVVDSDKNILQAKYFDNELARDVVDYLRREKFHMNVYVNDNLMAEKESKYIIDYATGKAIDYEIVKTLDDVSFDGLNKILAIDYDTDRIECLVSKMCDRYKDDLYVVKSTPYFCEISNPEATKGNGIRFLASRWGIKQDEIMAVGDQDNDIEMLLASGVRVAMGNATENLKKVSNFITKTVDEDGVVHAIEKFINLKDLKNGI